jgi:hypothetical protein
MLKYDSIVWLPDALMYYRVHDENDSNIEDTVGGIALLNYIAKKGISSSVNGPSSTKTTSLGLTVCSSHTLCIALLKFCTSSL